MLMLSVQTRAMATEPAPRMTCAFATETGRPVTAVSAYACLDLPTLTHPRVILIWMEPSLTPTSSSSITVTPTLTAPPSSSLRCRIPILPLSRTLPTTTWSAPTRESAIAPLVSASATTVTMVSPAREPRALATPTLARATASARPSSSWPTPTTATCTSSGIRTKPWAASATRATLAPTALRESASTAWTLCTWTTCPLSSTLSSTSPRSPPLPR
mmetsp:Transcript_29900/g.61475  ORF Transcript_29900/g.61475 Transcript_29900/m.61475 type:complete len:216 (+) Transcript_29900:117-764(+)